MKNKLNMSFTDFLESDIKTKKRYTNEVNDNELDLLASEYMKKIKTKYIPIDLDSDGDLSILGGINIRGLVNISFSYNKRRGGLSYTIGSTKDSDIQLLCDVLLEFDKNKDLIEEYISKRDDIMRSM